MVQKQSLRSRSKSASRSKKSETEKKSFTPVKPKVRKSLQTENKKDESPVPEKLNKSSEELIISSRRLTRLSRRKIETSTNETEVIDILSSDDEAKKIDKPLKSTKIIKKTNLTKKLGTGFISLVTLIILPILVFYFNLMAERKEKFRLVHLKEFKLEWFSNLNIYLAVVVWVIFLAVIAMLPIGWVKNKYNGRLITKYRCNGAITLILCLIIGTLLYKFKYLTTAMILSNYYKIIACSMVISFTISLLVLLKSYFSKSSKIIDDSDDFVMGFFTGREMNPTFWVLDLRFFFEFRPGFIGWALLNIIMVLSDLESKNFLSVNPSLAVLAASQFIYCLDALTFEGDIVSKSFMSYGRFGFVHCFGNMVIVPFLFSLITRATLTNNYMLPWKCLFAIIIINLIGYIIYRSSNWQKNSFRANPYAVNLAHLKTLTNAHGYQLLVGGWWGLLRHPNYLGDIIISLCWSLYTGFHLSVCWIYPIYFILFIISRCIEDEKSCNRKHGKTWTEYKHLVRYRLIPFIY